jgi:hypothetical protein
MAPMKNIILITACSFVALGGLTQARGEDIARLPEITVTETNLVEEARIGPYGQPEWTTKRRFSTTRVYVQQPPWGVGVEQWWRGRFLKGGDDVHLFQEEVEVGLPHRLQLDLYENWEITEENKVRHESFAAEVRWALADWGVIPLNPTLYGEWKFVDESADVYELKLLLGEELGPRWHWGLNAVYEQEVGGSRSTELALSQGLSYAWIDQKLSAGVEMKFVHETADGSRGDPEIKFLIGPSIQWRPTRHSHLDLVPLIGTTSDSPHVEAYVVFGIDIGAGDDRGYTPTSLKSH